MENDFVYAISFKDGSKCYYFKSDTEYQINDCVVVDTEKGLQYGKISKLVDNNKNKELKSIIRLATDEDEKAFMNNLKDADKAFKKAISIAKELELDMKIINAQYTLERTQLLFNFIADDRIDFRELAKRLAGLYHTRIELRQIGARDKAREIGGIGICGNKLCCAGFLKTMDTISMNMAKDQNLALNPSKINGACGRLLCCLAYEHETYLECSKNMPQVGDIIKVNGEEAEVCDVDILNRKCKVLINGEKEDYIVDENSKK